MKEIELGPRWPFAELTNLRREMDKLWKSFFSEEPLMKIWDKGWSPSLEVFETKDNFVVNAEIPGVDPKDIDISLTNEILTIKGQKKHEKEEKEENYCIIERTYGAFSRSIRLSAKLESYKAKATYTNGILRIEIPKIEHEKVKQIKVSEPGEPTGPGEGRPK